jgi:glycosyltransferase involved in cell wall biosynthesis
MTEEKLKIYFIGFDWNNIGINNSELTMSKLNRDGLQTGKNEFALLYAGNIIRRKVIRGNPYFSMWHWTFLTHVRIFYDIFFMLYLPVILIREKFKPDVFYLTDFPFVVSAILPAKIMGSKIIFRLNNLPTELADSKGVKGKIFSIYYWATERLTVPFIDKFIAINDTTKKYLLDLGVKENKIFIDVPDTMTRDAEYIKKADKKYIRKKHNISDDKKIILSVGSLIKEKGFEELLNSFAELKRKDLILIICGEGKEKDNLINLTKKLDQDDKIIFAGKIGREEIWHYFAGADIFTLFTKSESLGMVFWEAMLAGIPVIGTSVGGVKETIGKDGERGYYWNGDIEDLSKKIDLCLNDIVKREGIVKKAKKYVEEKIKQRININEVYNK